MMLETDCSNLVSSLFQTTRLCWSPNTRRRTTSRRITTTTMASTATTTATTWRRTRLRRRGRKTATAGATAWESSRGNNRYHVSRRRGRRKKKPLGSATANPHTSTVGTLPVRKPGVAGKANAKTSTDASFRARGGGLGSNIFNRNERLDVKKPGPFFKNSANNFFLDKVSEYSTRECGCGKKYPRYKLLQ